MKNSKIDTTVFVADNAKIIGDVKLYKNSSVWYNAVLRSDYENTEIIVGEGSNIQDNSTLHTDHTHSVIIGKNVTIGHNCIIHGCKIEDNCLIGMGAIILNGAVIKKGSIVAAGAVVKENFIVPENSLVAGVPAKIIKMVLEEQIKASIENAKDYRRLAQIHKNLRNTITKNI